MAPKTTPKPTPTNNVLAEKFTADPILIHPDRVQFAEAVLGEISAQSEVMKGFDSISAVDDFWGASDSPHPFRPYTVTNGVLQIPIQGILLNHFSYAFGRWATGYTYIEKALSRGLSDGNVRAIALVVHSPGGEVAGNFELADKIFAAREEKPIRAFASDYAYSAAYSLASAAQEIIITRSGGVGSIGVVMGHVDYSKALANYGIKITHIFAGKHKVDGNPYEKLDDAAKARFQERIDRLYAVFVNTVAKHRGIDEKRIRDTEALTYDAADSITQGLADRIGALDEEMVVFADEVAAEEEEQMALNDEHAAAVTKARTDGIEEGRKLGHAEGLTAGAVAERGRATQIQTSEEGKARPKAAQTMINNGIEAAVAIKMLADMDVEKPAATQPVPKPTGKTPFETAMDRSKNPEVGAVVDDEDEGEATGPQANAKFVNNVFESVGFSPLPRTN